MCWLFIIALVNFKEVEVLKKNYFNMNKRIIKKSWFLSSVSTFGKYALGLLMFLSLEAMSNINSHKEDLVTYKLEAEDAEVLGGKVYVSTSGDGYSGTGFVYGGSFTNGEALRFTADIAEGGAYKLIIRYSGNNDKSQALKFYKKGDQDNGIWVESVMYPATGGVFADVDFGGITLATGENIVEIHAKGGYTSFDYIELIKLPPSKFYEVEDANIKGGATVTTNIRGYSGTGHLNNETWQTGASVEFDVEAPNDGEYWLRIRHCSDADTKSQMIKINDEDAVVSRFPFTGYGIWGDYNYGKINLKAGANKISIIAYSTWVYFDYIDVTPYEQFKLTVANGSGSGDYDIGTKVEVVADTPPSGKMFDKWIGDVESIEFPESSTTNVNMTNKAVSIEASYRTPSYFDLTVNNGSGTGNHPEGEVAIVADAAPEGKVFAKWIGDTKGIDNFTKESTIYKITDMNATITATYRNADNTTNMALGTNFWFLASWSGEEAMKSDNNIDWATAYDNKVDIWNPVFVEELSIYNTLRFMDWAGTNNSRIRSWSERRPVTDTDNYYKKDIMGNGTSQGNAGLAYEWMIDLCNRTGTNLWINVPHKVKKEYWDSLSKLIAENLNDGLKCYIEYSNETWNVGFDQNGWIVNQGIGKKMPGADKNYKGGSYHVYISYKLFDSFEKSFKDAGRSADLVKVIATGGNMDYVIKAIRDNDPKVNPLNQKADAFSLAPYIGGGSGNLADDIDGQDPLALQKNNEWLRKQVSATEGNMGGTMGRIYQARKVADEFGMYLVAYEGGTHTLVHAEDWSKNPLIYDHYTNMMSVYEDYFDLYCHYVHSGRWFNTDGQGAWGSKVGTGSPLEEAHKYRALKDWAEKFVLADDAPILKLEPGVKEVDFKLYPNPVKNGNLIIESSTNKNSIVVVTNIMGQEMLRVDFKGDKLSISTVGISKGLYFVSIVNSNNISTQKIIIE